MHWMSWFSRLRRVSVLGLDVGLEVCSLVVLTGSASQPDSVCCAERLHLPDGLMAQGEVLRTEALGEWLRSYLATGDYQPKSLYIGVDGALLTHHFVTLATGLSLDDVAFQLQAEVQSLVPEHAGEVCIDFAPDTETSSTGQQRYFVQAIPKRTVEALRRVAQVAGITAQVVEPRYDAAQRVAQSHAFAQLPPASAALALQCDEAFGLALRAWHNQGINFLPHRENAQHVLRRAWLQGVAVCAVGGAVLAAGFAVVMGTAAETKYAQMGDVAASAREYDQAQKTYVQAKAEQARRVEQARWLQARKALQLQSLQWSHVLSQSAQGVWVVRVKQQGMHWTVQGEALSSSHAQQLVQQLKTLDIWAKKPELPQLQVIPAPSNTGLPVWEFRIEADLKVGV